MAQLIHENNLSYECLDHGINTVEVEAIIHRRPERIFVYSGTGGVILGERILSCGKRFLHAHAGALPAYRGSTTVYYSILQDDRCHASVIIMEPKIDCGRVVRTESYPKPRNGEIIDYVYDPYIRSDVLVKVLEEYAATGELPQRRQEPADAETYFIIHPVLKHLAILSCGE